MQLANYISCILIAVVMFATALYATYRIMHMTKDEQIANIKEWLKYAVAIAEKELGSGTGELKLRMVYQMAIEKFSWLSKIITFETFSGWVDEALIWLDGELSINEEISNYISKEV